MKKINFAMLFGALASTSLLATPVVKISNNYPNAIAKINEPIKFTISVTDEGKPVADKEINVFISGDKSIRSVKNIKTDATGLINVETKLTIPGMIQCVAKGGKGIKVAHSGVIVAPEQIQPSRPMPKDFNEYWDKVKKSLDSLPLNPVLTPVEKVKKNFVVYGVELNTDTAPAYGYLGFKKGAKPKSLPAKLCVHGASTYFVLPQWVQDDRFITFTLNPHSLPNGRDKKFYQDARKKELSDYFKRDPLDREKVYFNGMFRRVYRALQFLKSRPEWNGEILVVTGSSQGGGQALAAAGLDSAVTCVVAFVPAICDHGGSKAGRISGWPRYDYYSKEYRKDAEKVLQVLDYIDCVNFARNIKNAACFISVGSIDRTCVPTSVYSAFNVIPSKNKTMVVMPNVGHNVPKAVVKQANDFINNSLKPVK